MILLRGCCFNMQLNVADAEAMNAHDRALTVGSHAADK